MKSQFKIEQTLLKFGERLPLDDLTISSLSKAAGINRITFYKNYRSMVDLICTVLLKNIFFDAMKTQQTITLESSFSLAIDFMKKHPKFCRNLMASSYRQATFNFIQNEVMNYQLAEFNRLDPNHAISDLERKVSAKFYASGITTTFIDWIDHNYQDPIHQIYQATLTISKGFVDRIVHKKTQG